MKHKNRVVALLTDFGDSDQYVGVVKAVVLSKAPHVTIVDISHSVSPQDIDEGAFLLWSSYRFFPKGTIFAAIVDPGVGSKRKIMCLETSEYVFVAPDNGMLKFVMGEARNARSFSVENEKYFLPVVSSTFHGRDVFAPVCGYLARGVSPSKFGSRVTPKTTPERFVQIRVGSIQAARGHVIHVDRFGNLITNVRIDEGVALLRRVQIRFQRPGRKSYSTVDRFSRTYADAPLKTPFAIIGSIGLIEVSVKNGDAAGLLGVGVGTPFTIAAGHG